MKIYMLELIYMIGWDFYNIDNVTIQTLLFVIVVTLAIFVISLIIEIVRQKIFKLIYNSKPARVNRKWYQNYFEKLGLHIRW